MQKAYDVPQMLFTSTADAMQYPLADNRFDQVENGVENTMNYLGFLGGANILRNIPVVGKYAALDGAAYSQAAYDMHLYNLGIPALNFAGRNAQILSGARKADPVEYFK